MYVIVESFFNISGLAVFATMEEKLYNKLLKEKAIIELPTEWKKRAIITGIFHT